MIYKSGRSRGFTSGNGETTKAFLFTTSQATRTTTLVQGKEQQEQGNQMPNNSRKAEGRGGGREEGKGREGRYDGTKRTKE